MYEKTPEAEAFMQEILAVCKKYGFCIAHEDYGGAFTIVPYNEWFAEWLGDAFLYTKERAEGAYPARYFDD